MLNKLVKKSATTIIVSGFIALSPISAQAETEVEYNDRMERIYLETEKLACANNPSLERCNENQEEATIGDSIAGMALGALAIWLIDTLSD